MNRNIFVVLKRCSGAIAHRSSAVLRPLPLSASLRPVLCSSSAAMLPLTRSARLFGTTAASKSDKTEITQQMHEKIKQAEGAKKTEACSYHEYETTLPHPKWSKEQMEQVQVTHKPVARISDAIAYSTIRGIRFMFDTLSGYHFMRQNENSFLNRIIFLETVAGIPGYTAAFVRHFRSLRKMKPDYGWIHTLLEEAENERMHLLGALELKQPGLMYRGLVAVTQYLFGGYFFLSYLLSPKYAHRLVGYLEEEAVKTYTQIVKYIDQGKLPVWKQQPATPWMIKYWSLPENATMRDVILALRADEAHHREVNHYLSDLSKNREIKANPFMPGA